MFGLIIYFILAIVFGYFSTQNTESISLTFASYKIESIPLYVVLGITLLVGLFFSWLNGLFDSFVSNMKIRGKEHTIKDDKKIIHELTKKINQLELENAKLTGELKKESKDPNSL